MRLRLGDFCQARSGDKADIVNIAVFAPDAATFGILRDWLTPARVAAHLGGLVRGSVRRYEAPNVLGLNFVCEGALGGGGPCTLRSDVLGKTLAPNLLRLEIEVPDEVVRDLELLSPPG